MNVPEVTICILGTGDYYHFIRRCVLSVRTHCRRENYKLIVGGNKLSENSRLFLENLRDQGEIDHLILSERNIEKCPMMRQMIALVATDYIWWIEDDCQIVSDNALSERLKIVRNSLPEIGAWGEMAFSNETRLFSYGTDVEGYIKKAPWFKGRTIPASEVVTNENDTPFDERRWFFLSGACVFIRTDVLRILDWPDRALLRISDDIFLSEAMHQNGYKIQGIGPLGVLVNNGPRRNVGFEAKLMARQMSYYEKTSVR
jgi:hypothetical protein